MPLSPVHIESFGGLNLRDDPVDVGLSGSIDLLNVDFDQRGRVRSRNGYSTLTAVAGTNYYDSIGSVHVSGSDDVLVAGAGNRLEAITAQGGAIIATSTAPTTSPHFFANYGTPTSSRLYIANGVDTVRYYEYVSGFTTPVYTGTTPIGKYLAVQSPDNRLVVAGGAIPGVSAGNRVLFSDAGSPHVFGANNYVELSPGDTETITGMVAWREMLFVFKETHFFVFYGNSTDGTGQPVFNYRRVDGAGLRLEGAVTAGTDGVYFYDRGGIYQTTGGPPRLISEPVSPLFVSLGPTVTNSFTGTTSSRPQMHWMDDRLYFAFPSTVSTNDRVLVHSTTDGWWSMWDIAARALHHARTSASDPLKEELVFAYTSAATKHLGKVTTSATDDNGTAITSRYRSGFGDLGHPGQEKTIRETELVGQGSVSFAYARDFGSITTSSTATVALGTAPATVRRLHRKSQDGELFSWQAASVSGGAWQLSALTPFVRDVRGPAETTS